MRHGSIFGCFSQCSVITNAGKHRYSFFTWSKLKATPVREAIIAGVPRHLMPLHNLALNNKCDEVLDGLV